VLTQLRQLNIKDHENSLLNLHQEFKRLVGIKSAKKKKGKKQPKSHLIDPATIPVAGPPVTDSTERDKQLPPPTYIDNHTIILRQHYRLGHTPFAQLKQMAKYGLLADKRLATIHEFPFCLGCQFENRRDEHGGIGPTRNFDADNYKKPGNPAMLCQSTPLTTSICTSIMTPKLLSKPNLALNNLPNPSMSGSSIIIATMGSSRIKHTKQLVPPTTKVLSAPESGIAK
jgi:hypothetical protein